MKTQGQLLDLAQLALSKQKCSTLVVISSPVANAMVLVKNHMLEFDTEILRKEFTVDEMVRAVLVDNAYDTTQHFVSLYDLSTLDESNDNNSPSSL
jgi:hypothetical protein